MRRVLWAVAVAALLWGLAGCGTDDATGSTTEDALVSDVTEVADVAADVLPDLVADSLDAVDVAPDSQLDSQPDAAGPDAEADAGPQGCEAPLEQPVGPPDASLTKFSLTMFHYNIEYVIGGLQFVGDDGELELMANVPENEGWDNARVEDWIVTETLAPILEMYEKHPSWAVTIELQAYFIEVLAQRHPDVLEQLRRMATAGQVELVSFHYAAQLFLAFPREDQQRSLERVREVFALHCLPLSGVVFNQEGQAGEGRQQMLVDAGYTIGVHPKNLFDYVRHQERWWPYYTSRGGTLIVGPGGVDPDSGVDVSWEFFDDGELRSVGQFTNPYLASFFGHEPERVAEYEQKLTEREAAGYKLTTITDYVRHLEAQGVDKPEAPPLVDGTWQPPSTDSIHRWLGGRSEVFVGSDEDNTVRAGNARARMHVAATQVLLEHAADEGHVEPEWDARIRVVWDNLLHAEVSDCSGVNPWRGEVVFGIRMNAWLIAETTALREELLAALGYAHAMVNLDGRTATELDDIPLPEPFPVVEAGPFELAVVHDTRSADVEWREVGADHYQVVVSFGVAPEDACDDVPDETPCDPRIVSVGFPRTHDVIEYSPGLLEDEVVAHAFDVFNFRSGEVYLPLANGLIGLGDGWYVVKHVRHQHIAARIGPKHPNVDFIDATIPRDTNAAWVFDVLKGEPTAALARANRINITPVVFY